MSYWSHQQFSAARRTLCLTRVELADDLDCGLRTVQRCEVEGCRKVMALAMMWLLSESGTTSAAQGDMT
jgi:hypothetical protein